MKATGIAALAALLAVLGAANAAAEPIQVAAQGRMTAGGGPVADGVYALSVALYPQQTGGASVFEEPFLAINVSGGVFALALGAAKYPLDSALFATGGPLWVGVTVGADELPRIALARVPFASHAITAKMAADVQCSGCVGDTDLAKGAVTGEKIAAGAVGANHVSFNWAMADGPGGAATFALDANKAKLAEQAKVADQASFADDAGSAKGLACTGCVKDVQLADGAVTAKKLAADALDWKNLKNVPAGFADNVDDATSAADILKALAATPPDLAAGTKIAGTPAARIVSLGNTALANGKAISLDTGAKSPAVHAQVWFLNDTDNTWILGNSGQSVAAGSCADCGSGADGVFNPQSSTTLSTGKKYQFTEFLIPKGVVVTVTGTAALEVKASKRIQIDGTLFLDGGKAVDSVINTNGCSSNNGQSVPGTAGPGGYVGGTSTYGVYTSVNGDGPGGGIGAGNGVAAGNGGGGGGGGYGTNGGSGTQGGPSSSQAPPGVGGGTYAGITAGSLQGGSGGGGGGYGTAYNAAGTGGGGGGGAVKLEAPEITVSGKISANGGGGGNSNTCDGGQGGGGAGGAIWLRGAKVDFSTGTLTAQGGPGGLPDVPSGADGGPGGNGGAGKVRVDCPGTIGGTANPSYAKGDASGLTLPASNAFAIDQTAPGVVRLTNLSGAQQNVVLVVSF